MEISIAVGYLTAYVLRGARKIGDAAVDGLLDRLADRVRDKLGPGPQDRIRQQQGDSQSRKTVARQIEVAMAGDRRFARDVADLVAALDQLDSQKIIKQFIKGNGIAVGGDVTNSTLINGTVIDAPHPMDHSGTPLWARTTAGIGAGISFMGIVVVFVGIFQFIGRVSNPQPGPTEFPGSVPAGFVIFLVGMGVFGLGAMGMGFSRRQRQPLFY